MGKIINNEIVGLKAAADFLDLRTSDVRRLMGKGCLLDCVKYFGTSKTITFYRDKLSELNISNK